MKEILRTSFSEMSKMYKKVRNPKEWTKEQVNFALDNWKILTNEEIGNKIGKTGNAVEQKLRNLGVSRLRRVSIEPGVKYSRLTAVEFSHKHQSYSYWKFKCDCGKEKIMRASDVAATRTISCGCFSREQFDKLHGIPENEGAKRDIFYTYKKNAENRKYSFELTREEVDKITQQTCYYCGTPPSRKYRQDRNHRSKNYVYNGIDRFDNNLGYTLENSRPCCRTCNQAKMDMSVEEFTEWLERLVRYQSDKID